MVKATIGQYSDFLSWSFSGLDLSISCSYCWKGAAKRRPVRNVRWNHADFCDSCFFKYTVMEAAGRAEEFWQAYDARNTYEYQFDYRTGDHTITKNPCTDVNNG